MKKRWLIALCACFTLVALAGCESAKKSPSDSIGPESSGNLESSDGTNVADDAVIDLPDSVQLDLNETFSFAAAAALYEGNIVYPTVTVKYNGEEVTVSEKSFVVEKVGVYTLTFTFDFGGVAHEEIRTVTGVDKTPPAFIASSEFELKYTYGDIVTLPTFTVVENTGETLSATVKVYKGDEEIVVSNGQFTISDYTNYKVVVTAEDASKNKGVKEYILEVRGETEFEYMNSKDYVAKTISITQGAVAFNDNKTYVVEGEGSLKLTTNKDARYPVVYFEDPALAVSDYENIHSISFWVYNAAAQSFKFNLVTYKLGVGASIITNFTVPAKSWKYCTVQSSAIVDAFAAKPETDTLGIFVNGDDQADYFQALNLYFDAFEIHTTAPTKNYAINANDLSYTENEVVGDKVEVLTAADLGADINPEKLMATLTNASGDSEKLVWENNKFLIPNVLGTYTVDYVYMDGANGNSVRQTITIKEKVNVPTKEEGINFDNNTYAGLEIKQSFGTIWRGLEPCTAEAKGAYSLKVVPQETDGTVFKVIIPQEWRNAINPETDELQFDLRVTGSSKWAMRAYTVSGSTTKYFIYDDAWAPNVWKTTSMVAKNRQEAMQAIKDTGYFFIMEGGLTNEVGQVFWIDNIRIVNINTTPELQLPDGAQLEVGQTFSFASAVAVYQGNNVYPTVTVTYDGEEVSVSDKSFVVEQEGVYTVTFTFDFDGVSHVETRTVTGVATTSSTAPSMSEGINFDDNTYGGLEITQSYGEMWKGLEACTAEAKGAYSLKVVPLSNGMQFKVILPQEWVDAINPATDELQFDLRTTGSTNWSVQAFGIDKSGATQNFIYNEAWAPNVWKTATMLSHKREGAMQAIKDRGFFLIKEFNDGMNESGQVYWIDNIRIVNIKKASTMAEGVNFDDNTYGGLEIAQSYGEMSKGLEACTADPKGAYSLKVVPLSNGMQFKVILPQEWIDAINPATDELQFDLRTTGSSNWSVQAYGIDKSGNVQNFIYNEAWAPNVWKTATMLSHKREGAMQAIKDRGFFLIKEFNDGMNESGQVYWIDNIRIVSLNTTVETQSLNSAAPKTGESFACTSPVAVYENESVYSTVMVTYDSKEVAVSQKRLVADKLRVYTVARI